MIELGIRNQIELVVTAFRIAPDIFQTFDRQRLFPVPSHTVSGLDCQVKRRPTQKCSFSTVLNVREPVACYNDGSLCHFIRVNRIQTPASSQTPNDGEVLANSAFKAHPGDHVRCPCIRDTVLQTRMIRPGLRSLAPEPTALARASKGVEGKARSLASHVNSMAIDAASAIPATACSQFGACTARMTSCRDVSLYRIRPVKPLSEASKEISIEHACSASPANHGTDIRFAT